MIERGAEPTFEMMSRRGRKTNPFVADICRKCVDMVAEGDQNWAKVTLSPEVRKSTVLAAVRRTLAPLGKTVASCAPGDDSDGFEAFFFIRITDKRTNRVARRAATRATETTTEATTEAETTEPSPVGDDVTSNDVIEIEDEIDCFEEDEDGI